MLETIENEVKERKKIKNCMLGTLVASLFGYLLSGKGLIKAGQGTISAKVIAEKDGGGWCRKKIKSGWPYHWWSSVKFRVHFRVEWFWLLKLKYQVIRF